MVFLVFSTDNPIDIFIGTYMTAMFILLNTQASLYSIAYQFEILIMNMQFIKFSRLASGVGFIYV